MTDLSLILGWIRLEAAVRAYADLPGNEERDEMDAAIDELDKVWAERRGEDEG